MFVLGIALYVVALYTCYRVLRERQSPGATTAWILLNLVFPIIGVPLYFVLGKSRLRGFTRRHQQLPRTEDEDFDECTLPSTGSSSPLKPESLREEFAKTYRRFGHIYDLRQGDAELLIDGKDTYQAIFAAIDKAQRFILVQYYILRHDRLGLELKDLLVKKARSGIPVYLLYDDMGSFWLSRKYVSDLKAAGVKVARFLPVMNITRAFMINFRNHRKLVVVDGDTAFTGGLNVGEEYATRLFKTKKQMHGYWRDSHIKVSGGGVDSLTEVFIEDWLFATQDQLDRSTLTSKSAAPRGEMAIQVIPTGPTDDVLISVMLFLQLISSAKTRLWITTPYFIPDPTLMCALHLAATRGVDVRVMIPKDSDSMIPIVHWASYSYAQDAQARGIKICVYEKGFMHQKVVLVDDQLAAIGTMNLDNRTLYLNFETMVLVHDRKFAASVHQMLENDLLSCRYLPRRPKGHIGRRLRADFTRLLAPLL